AATMENDSAHRPKKQDEFSRVPSAVLKARGAASRAPVRMLCNALTGYSDDDSDHCDEIFERRTPDDMHPDVFNKHYAHRLRDGEPVLEHLLERLPLRTGSSGDDPIIAASWIPVPLEVARNDRQTNATTALLGWALLEETSQAINCVMQGSARIAGEQIMAAMVNLEAKEADTEEADQPTAEEDVGDTEESDDAANDAEKTRTADDAPGLMLQNANIRPVSYCRDLASN
ncbi:MAG: hypothetical protein AAGF33_10690, partial [Pseudomonadota bacterium]